MAVASDSGFEFYAQGSGKGFYQRVSRRVVAQDQVESSGEVDVLELLDDRYGNRSTLVTSQMPVDKWHALIGDPTLGDAILDRLVHNAYRIELKGESMRRRATKLTTTGTSD